MGYEVLSAFFLEAGFLGVMLFGLKRVGPGFHFFATLMVAIGTLFSAFWILSVNSWMQTPAGFAVNANGQFVPKDWWEIVFNPSFPYRLVHMVLAAYLTTAFVVGGVGAFHLLRDQKNRSAALMFSMAMWMAVLVTPVQIVAGDLHGLNTLEYQPAKIAAMEGHYETRSGAPLLLFGLPDNSAGETRAAIEIPKLGSLILTHDPNGTIIGLKHWPRADWPNALLIFWTFRVMVGLGFAMLGLGIWSLMARLRRNLATARLLQRAAVVMAPSGFVAVVAGWITTEAGRQPYTVYGLLRTLDSASPIAAPAVGASLAGFAIVYFAVFGAGVFYILRQMVVPPRDDLPPGSFLNPAIPLHAAGLMPAPVRTLGKAAPRRKTRP
jgi:cytochrome d ubiquinol oxidase subunit I